MKNNKDGKPLRAKSRIIVWGNLEYHLYQKSQRYAPALKYSSLRLLAAKSVGYKRILQQGGCKNAFSNATLPDDEVTVIRPPIGNLAFQDDDYWFLNKTLYVLHRYPHHWYNIIKGVLLKMCLNTSPHDPCLLSGVIANPFSPDTISAVQSQLHVSLYVDDIAFYSSDPTQEALLKTLIQEHIQFNFMGDVNYTLGTSFTWLNTQIRERLRPSMPIAIHWIHSLSVIGSHCQQGYQHDSISFRFPHWFHSSRWPPQSRSSTSKTGISEYCWLHQLAGNLHSPWHYPCTHLSCLVQQCSPPTTLQGRSLCS